MYLIKTGINELKTSIKHISLTVDVNFMVENATRS